MGSGVWELGRLGRGRSFLSDGVPGAGWPFDALWWRCYLDPVQGNPVHRSWDGSAFASRPPHPSVPFSYITLALKKKKNTSLRQRPDRAPNSVGWRREGGCILLLEIL